MRRPFMCSVPIAKLWAERDAAAAAVIASLQSTRWSAVLYVAAIGRVLALLRATPVSGVQAWSEPAEVPSLFRNSTLD